ncbi:MAG: KH domain-containing protein [Clostridia bacterium]|nr:KH domain-containing protein [Clostridia bacterium]
MKAIVEVLVKSLVDKPEEVQVIVNETDRNYFIELKVASEDMGKVIGKQGRVAKALRTVVKAASVKKRKKVTLDIV